VSCGTDAPPRVDAPLVPVVITRRDPEPAGPHCPRGGLAIKAGVDRNGNGALDDDEVDHTDYVCDVATTVLVRKDPLAPGPECPKGGIAVQTGVDDNGDGVLQDAEIDQTTHVCSSLELWDGDFTADDWKDPLKVAALHGARVVTGALAIVSDPPVSLPVLERVVGNLTGSGPIVLPALREVGGNVGLAGDATAAPSLPALTHIGGNAGLGASADVVPSLPVLGRIEGALVLGGSGGRAGLVDAPSLSAIGGRLDIAFDARSEVSLPGLRTIAGDLQQQGQLSALHLDGLVTLGGGVHLEDFSNIAHLAFPALQTVAGDIRSQVTGLATLEAPRLTHLGGSLTFHNVTSLTAISLPAMFDIGGHVSLDHNGALATVDFGTLQVVGGSFTILTAPALTTLSVTRLTRIGIDTGGPDSVSLGGTGLEVLDLAALQTLDGALAAGGPALREVRLPSLTIAKRLVFGDAPRLDRITAPLITGLTSIDIDAPGLHTLDFGHLTDVGFLGIANAPLADLSGLGALRRVDQLYLSNLSRLQDLRGLSSLHTASSLDLSLNPALTSLEGLELLVDLPGHLTISGNHALTSIAGLANVVHVGGLLNLEGNSMLTSAELTRLRTIDGTLRIAFTSLTSLSGLAALRSVGGDLDMTQNDGLSSDDILAFRHQLGR
jgi:hypothetical protein